MLRQPGSACVRAPSKGGNEGPALAQDPLPAPPLLECQPGRTCVRARPPAGARSLPDISSPERRRFPGIGPPPPVGEAALAPGSDQRRQPRQAREDESSSVDPHTAL